MNAYGNYDDFEKDHIKFLKDQKRIAEAMEEEEYPEFKRIKSSRRVNSPIRREVIPSEASDNERAYVRPHIIRLEDPEGHSHGDYDASPHPVFRRVLDPALNRAFPKHSDDHDSEKDLVGSIDKNEDWATSLQSEERSI